MRLYEEVFEACGTAHFGTLQEIAAQGLAEAGYDVRLLESFDFEQIKEALEEGRPPIITLKMKAPLPMGHAVVVCALDASTIMVMDPLRGDYVSLDLGVARALVDTGVNGVLLVGFQPERRE